MFPLLVFHLLHSRPVPKIQLAPRLKIASHLRINKGIKNPKNNANFAANQATMKAKQVAIQAALKANDYNAWVTAVGANAPILQKINATNFSTYVQIYNLRQQEQVLETQLGLTKGMGMGGHFELGDK